MPRPLRMMRLFEYRTARAAFDTMVRTPLRCLLFFLSTTPCYLFLFFMYILAFMEAQRVEYFVYDYLKREGLHHKKSKNTTDYVHALRTAYPARFFCGY